MASLTPTTMHLSRNQLMKIARGQPVQVSHANLMKATHTLHLHPMNAHKVHTAKRKHKGVRIHLSHEEVEGSGIGDWFRNAGNWIKDHIINTPVYQSIVKPAARQLVNAGIAAESDLAGPEVAPLLNKAANAVGDATGAFGLRGHHKKKKHHVHLRGGHENVEVNYVPSPSQMVWPSPLSPSKTRSGSFLAA